MSSCKLSAVSPHHNFDSSSSYHRDQVVDGGQGEASEPSSKEVLTAEILVGEERQEEFEAAGVEMEAEVEQDAAACCGVGTRSSARTSSRSSSICLCLYMACRVIFANSGKVASLPEYFHDELVSKPKVCAVDLCIDCCAFSWCLVRKPLCFL